MTKEESLTLGHLERTIAYHTIRLNRARKARNAIKARLKKRKGKPKLSHQKNTIQLIPYAGADRVSRVRI